MSKRITKKERKTCPNCNGGGSRYGHNRCSHCHGRGFVTETTTWTVEEVNDE